MGSPQQMRGNGSSSSSIEAAFAPDLGPQDDVRTFIIQAPDDSR
jgi:hypothetical protein